MFAEFWTQILSTDSLSSFELRIIAEILKRLNFENWMVIDSQNIAKKLNLDETEVTEVVQKLIGYQILECKGECVKQSCYRYRLNSNFGWNKSFGWVFADGIDWQAFLTSFQKLQRKFELTIRAIENKSNGTLVIHLGISALANLTEVKKCLKHEYNAEIETLKEKYRIKYNDKEIAIHQQNSANLLKIIELIVKTSKTLHNIVESKALPQNKPVKQNLDYNNTVNQRETAENHLQTAPKQKQTLAEAVAERGKSSKQPDLTEADKMTYLDDNYVDNQDESSFLKRKIKARLNKHCH